MNKRQEIANKMHLDGYAPDQIEGVLKEFDKRVKKVANSDYLKKVKRLGIVFSIPLYKSLEKAAAKVGEKPTQFARLLVERGLLDLPLPLSKGFEQSVIVELRRFSNLMNQLVRHAHTEGSLGQLRNMSQTIIDLEASFKGTLARLNEKPARDHVLGWVSDILIRDSRFLMDLIACISNYLNEHHADHSNT